MTTCIQSGDLTFDINASRAGSSRVASSTGEVSSQDLAHTQHVLKGGARSIMKNLETLHLINRQHASIMCPRDSGGREGRGGAVESEDIGRGSCILHRQCDSRIEPWIS